MAKRFVAREEDIQKNENEIILSGEEVKHIHVLRFEIDDEIQINEYICKITKVTKKEIYANIISKAEEKGVPKNNITLYQALLKSDKMEYVIQKSVELGVKKIVPITTRNIVVKLDEKDKIKKVERWNKISIEASKQCARTDIVKVEKVENINALKLDKEDLVIFAYEHETASLKETLIKIKEKESPLNIAIIIGAEGGFDKDEVEKIAKKVNVKVVSLGERILRAETASLNLLSILGYELED